MSTGWQGSSGGRSWQPFWLRSAVTHWVSGHGRRPAEALAKQAKLRLDRRPASGGQRRAGSTRVGGVLAARAVLPAGLGPEPVHLREEDVGRREGPRHLPHLRRAELHRVRGPALVRARRHRARVRAVVQRVGVRAAEDRAVEPVGGEGTPRPRPWATTAAAARRWDCKVGPQGKRRSGGAKRRTSEAGARDRGAAPAGVVVCPAAGAVPGVRGEEAADGERLGRDVILRRRAGDEGIGAVAAAEGHILVPEDNLLVVQPPRLRLPPAALDPLDAWPRAAEPLRRGLVDSIRDSPNLHTKYNQAAHERLNRPRGSNAVRGVPVSDLAGGGLAAVLVGRAGRALRLCSPTVRPR
jgi:hypothetical protein